MILNNSVKRNGVAGNNNITQTGIFVLFHASVMIIRKSSVIMYDITRNINQPRITNANDFCLVIFGIPGALIT